MAKNSLLEITDNLNILMYKNFPHETVGDKFCYINQDGEYMILHDVNHGEYIFFEYANNREEMMKDITSDGGWFYIPDYPDAEVLFKDVVKQINGSS